MRLLRVTLIAQLVLMLPAAAFFLATRPSIYTPIVLFFLVPIGFVVTLFAFWQAVRYPSRKGLALLNMATPIVCLGAPFMVTAAIDGPIPPGVLIGAALALIAVGAIGALGRRGLWKGTGRFASAKFNLVVLAALGALLLLFWAPIIVLASNGAGVLGVDVTRQDPSVHVAAVYFVTLAVPALLLSVPTLLYAPVGLVRNGPGAVKLVHLGQLAAALATLATVAALSFVAFMAMMNPG